MSEDSFEPSPTPDASHVLDVLLVEDNPVDRAGVERLVSQKALPWRLRCASTLAEARALITDQPPDLALLDHHLPDGSGSELRENLHGIPHIFITGSAEVSVAVELMREGASDFLLKGVDTYHMELLPNAVERAMELHRLRRSEARKAEELEYLVSRRTEALLESQAQLERESTLNAAMAELTQTLIKPGLKEDEVAGTILSTAQALTRSEHGYVSAVDPITLDNVGVTLTQMMGDPCRVEGGGAQISFPIGADGRYGSLWGWSLDHRVAFYTNDPSAHPGASGLPGGHIPLRNFISAPAMWGETLIGQVALANAPGDYDEDDLRAVIRVTEIFAAALVQKRSEMEIRESRESLRALTSRLNEIREEERSSLAREVHDEIGQRLTVLRMDLSGLEESLGSESGDEDLKAVRRLKALADDTLELMRDLAARLRSPLLDVMGLQAAVEWQVEEFEKQFGVEGHLDMTQAEEPIRGAVATEAYRILQETLNNVARHASARVVDVTLRLEDRRLFLEVTDDGIGIDPEARVSGRSFGLMGMRERAVKMGGRFEVGGGPDAGTRVLVEIPLEKPAPSEAC